jgi:hypothetical protein
MYIYRRSSPELGEDIKLIVEEQRAGLCREQKRLDSD